MSLINDALKRAQGQNPGTGSSPGVPFQQPGHPRGTSRARRSGKPNIALLLVMGLIVAGIVYYYMFMSDQPIVPAGAAGKSKITEETKNTNAATDDSSTKNTKRVSISGAVQARTSEEGELAPQNRPSFLDIFSTEPKSGGNKPVQKNSTPPSVPETTPNTEPPDNSKAVVTVNDTKLTLSGTMILPKTGSVAIINGTPYRVGEQIHGATIIEIENRKVTLRHQGNVLQLFVP